MATHRCLLEPALARWRLLPQLYSWLLTVSQAVTQQVVTWKCLQGLDVIVGKQGQRLLLEKAAYVCVCVHVSSAQGTG